MTGSAATDHAATPTIRLAGGAQGFNWLPVFVAEEWGLFERAGVRIEYQRLGSVDKVTAAVREGSADLAITPPEGAIADHLAGGDLRIVGSNSERLPMSLVARPGIADLAGLRGAVIGTSSLTEGTAVYVRSLLRRVGLEYPRDYDFALAGIHTSRWQALRDGEVDAAPQPTPWSLLAEREGFGLLGEISDALPEIVFAAVIARGDLLEKRGDAVRGVLSALADAHDLVNDPANDSRTIPVYQRITTPDEPELAARGFAQTRDLGMWPTGLRVSPAAFATTVDTMIEAGLAPENRRDDAAGVIDARFLHP